MSGNVKNVYHGAWRPPRRHVLEPRVRSDPTCHGGFASSCWMSRWDQIRAEIRPLRVDATRLQSVRSTRLTCSRDRASAALLLYPRQIRRAIKAGFVTERRAFDARRRPAETVCSRAELDGAEHRRGEQVPGCQHSAA